MVSELHHIFQKSVVTTSNLVATIQASRASECQYRKLAAAVAAMEAKLNCWRLANSDIHSIQAVRTSTSRPSRNSKPAQLVVDAGLKILSTSFPGRELE